MPVLLQHTAGSDGRQWRHLLEDPELTAHYRFIAYDLPYHGKSVPPVGVEWWKQEYLRAVIAVQGSLATHDEEPFNQYMWHPRVTDDLKSALMFTMMSPASPESLRRETSWLYAQGAPAVHKGDLVYYLGEHDLTETAKDIDTGKTAVYVLSGDYDWSATPDKCRAGRRHPGGEVRAHGQPGPLPDG
jgi:hypothetical protein